MSSPVWYPPQPPKKKPILRYVLLAVAAFVVLCFGGLATLGAIIGGPDAAKTKAAADQQTRPAVALPTSSSPEATPTLEATAAAPITAAPATTAPAAAPTAVAPTTTAAVKPSPRATTRPATPKPKPKPTTKRPKPKPTTKPPTAGTVHPGAFCSPEGAHGVTSKGTPMRCTLKAGEDRARWRKA